MDYDEREGEGEEEYIDLDLEKTLTWTGNAVIVQAGGEFRLPLIVPHPSVLAIQFEVENGNDIEFSLLFKDDQENDYQVLVEPVRVSDREGQLDIDTTGVCELLWSNAHAWFLSKTLSYQLQLAPKLDIQKKKWITAILSAAHDYRLVSAAEAAEQVDNSMRTLKQRTASLEETLASNKEKEKEAQLIYERYTGHVKRLEEEVEAAKQHVEQAAGDLASKQRDVAQTQRSLTAIQQISTMDDGITNDMRDLLEEVEEPLSLIYEAYAGALYADEDEEQGEGSKAAALDRTEYIHFLQEFGILGRSEPPEIMCGIFYGCPQQLTPHEFKRCLARSALALAPDDEEGNKLLWLLAVVAENLSNTKMAALDIPRRVKVLEARRILSDIIYEPEEPGPSQSS